MRRLRTHTVAPVVLAVLLAAAGCSSGTSTSTGSSGTSSAVSSAPSSTRSSAATSSTGSGASAGASSGASSTGQSALCDSVTALQASVQRLKDVDLSQSGGIANAQAALSAVGANVQQVVTDAKAQYRTQIDQLNQDTAAMRTTADAAQATPNGATLSALGQSIRKLGDDIGALVTAVTPSC